MLIMIGKTISHYQVLEKLGEGGMGVVYHARDSKLNRDVALKVLPELFAKNAERMARFRREAQVLASLNHPNIATIYGLEQFNGHCALVMELVEGPTLAESIAAKQPLTRNASGGPPKGRGVGREGSPLPMDEALAIARQLAQGLEYAHERGIV